MNKKYPLIYEINTWVWCSDLSRQYYHPIDLSNIPSQEWDRIAALGFDAVWLMGVWERSPFGIQIALQNPGLLDDFHQALPDYTQADVVGSPYCVRQYVVARQLGGPAGLVAARKELKDRGIHLILDYVPNHVAPDHPWTTYHPEYFIQGSPVDLAQDPSSFIQIGSSIIARGRDPNFPAWPDVVQLNAYHAGLRQAVTQTLLEIASQCDGLRVDMAMLMFNIIFKQTWGNRTGPVPQLEFWVEIINTIKQSYPDLVWIAEAYWNTEAELHRQGFDFCYDKSVYDFIRDAESQKLEEHLHANPASIGKLVHFTENHDEKRAVVTFPFRKDFLAAIASYTLPGARLFHEGQIVGRKVRVPVFLGRRAAEPEDAFVRQFYEGFCSILCQSAFQGEWRLCPAQQDPETGQRPGSIAWYWINERRLTLIVLNLASSPCQAAITLDRAVETSARVILSHAVYPEGSKVPICFTFTGPGYFIAEYNLV
jgi:hypothetical protein